MNLRVLYKCACEIELPANWNYNAIPALQMRWLGAKVFTQNFSRHLGAILCHYGPYVQRRFMRGPTTAIIVAIIICPLVVINHSQLYPVAVVKIQRQQRPNRRAKSPGKYLRGFKRRRSVYLGSEVAELWYKWRPDRRFVRAG